LRLLLFQLAGKARSSAKQTSFFKRRKAPKAARYTTSERAYWEELPELLLGANHFLLFPNLSTSKHKALLPHRTYRPRRHQSTGRVPLASSPTAAPRSLTGRHPPRPQLLSRAELHRATMPGTAALLGIGGANTETVGSSSATADRGQRG
jgi:hypothetical protein